jgi:hypothetical protein
MPDWETSPAYAALPLERAPGVRCDSARRGGETTHELDNGVALGKVD